MFISNFKLTKHSQNFYTAPSMLEHPGPPFSHKISGTLAESKGGYTCAYQ